MAVERAALPVVDQADGEVGLADPAVQRGGDPAAETRGGRDARARQAIADGDIKDGGA